MRWRCAIVLALTVAACGKEAPPEAPPQAAMPAPPAAPQVPAPAPAEPTDEDVAVAEDFIEEATAEVTAANYKAKLVEIEREMAAEAE